MAKYLHAAYALRIRKLYLDNKSKIEKQLKQSDSHATNRKRITLFSLPLIQKAYSEGIKYAVVDVKQRTGQEIKKNFKISNGQKNNLLELFVVYLRTVEKALDTDMESLKIIRKTQRLKLSKDDIQAVQYWNKYVNAVSTIVSNLLVRSGSIALMSVYDKIKRI